MSCVVNRMSSEKNPILEIKLNMKWLGISSLMDLIYNSIFFFTQEFREVSRLNQLLCKLGMISDYDWFMPEWFQIGGHLSS